MPPTEHVTVEESNPGALAAIGRRAEFPMFGVRTIEALEAQEKEIFASYGGEYVDSGALRDSLTESAASGAVRVLAPGTLDFGTSIFYARFQGTRGLGHHQGPSAILKPTALEAVAAARDVKDYIMYGERL